MKTLLDILLFVVGVSAYFRVYWAVAQYRRARTIGPDGKSDYRADRDVVLDVAMLLVGGLLCLGAYLAVQALSPLL